MSRQIDWQKPLSAEDEQWARQFSQHDPLLALHREQFPEEYVERGEDSLEGTPDDDLPPYEEWSKKDLVTEVNRRPTTTMPTGKATAADLAVILNADDDATDAAAAAATGA